MKIQFQDKELFMDLLYKRVEPYHQLAHILDHAIQEKEQILFGEQAELVGALWRATVFVRGTELPPGVNIKSIREPLLKMLIEKKYDEAKYYIEELMAKYPNILPDYVAANLKIEPEVLKKLYEEETPEKEGEKLSSRIEQQRKDRIVASETLLNDFVGKELVSPDGKISLTISAYRSGFDTTPNFFVNSISVVQSLIGHRSNTMRAQDLLALIELFNLSPKEIILNH